MTAGRAAPPLTAGGRVLLACYALFAVAAGGRSAYQLATRAADAPLAYGLSAFAALVYLVALVALRARRRALAAICAVELAGVLAVGTVSMLLPDAFPDETVWSGYGVGYGFVPAVLPVCALGWLLLRRRREAVRD